MKRPCDWIDPWPSGAALDDAPRAATWLAEVAVIVAAAPGGGSAVAADAAVPVSVVQAIVDGTAWPSLNDVLLVLDAVEGGHQQR